MVLSLLGVWLQLTEYHGTPLIIVGVVMFVIGCEPYCQRCATRRKRPAWRGYAPPGYRQPLLDTPHLPATGVQMQMLAAPQSSEDPRAAPMPGQQTLAAVPTAGATAGSTLAPSHPLRRAWCVAEAACAMDAGA